jgi:thiol:disulfide interchange protein DsbC
MELKYLLHISQGYVKKRAMSKKWILPSLFLCFLVSGYAHGFETKGQDCSKCHTLTRDEARDLIKTMAPDIKVLEVNFSPIKPLWEVFSETGGRKMIVYVDVSKKYLISGSMFSLKDRKNLTQESFNALNKVDISQIPLKDSLVMGDEKAKIRVIVFTDPD